MAKHVGKAQGKLPAKGGSAIRSSSSGRFLAVASLKPVTKRATITSAQADKAVKAYLSEHSAK